MRVSFSELHLQPSGLHLLFRVADHLLRPVQANDASPESLGQKAPCLSGTASDVQDFCSRLDLAPEVPISTNEGFDYKHLYFIALHDFQVASF